MKICMISYSQYEFDNRVHRYAESLIEHGDSVDVICLGAKDQARHDVLNHVHIYRVMSRNYNEKSPFSYLIRMVSFFISSSWKCSLLHLRHGYDVCHFHNIPDFGVFSTLIPKLLGAKVILDVHDLVPEFYQRKFNLEANHIIVRFLKWIEKISCAYADHVITVTTIWEMTLIDRSVPAQKCTVILNSPDPYLFNRSVRKTHQTSHGFRLNYHGNLTEIFGIDLAIRAMPIMIKSIPDISLHIYGQGKTREDLIRFANELGVSNEVIFHEPVPRSQVPHILHLADIGIDPKRNGILAGEGLSSKCMEYLAVGLPTVVSRIKAADTYYEDDMVMFFEPGNEKDLAQKVIELYKHPKKRKQLIENSTRFNEKHHWNRYRESYFKTLDNLVKIK